MLVQLAVPAAYYVRGEASEERFAWRMFSDVWWYHKTCRIALTERLDARAGTGGSARPVDLDREYHAVWPRQLQRARRSAVDKVLRQRCDADPSVGSVVFSRTCPDAPPSRMPALRVTRDCRTGVIERTRPGGTP